jgi:hypothetical protein
LHSTDLSNALEKAVDHLDNSESDEPFLELKCDKPFSLQMRLYRYVKAYKVQMRDKSEVDECRYDHLIFKSTDDSVRITSALEQDTSFVITDEKGNNL